MGDNSIVIGIDLGTTNTCAYYYIDEKIECLENRAGGRQTPSHVHFTSKKVVVGEYARKMNACNPEKGFCGAKRLLGRSFSQVQPLTAKMKSLSLVTENALNNKPIISVETENGKVSKTPQEICAIILRRVKEDAEEKLGCEITKTVITVPAYFDTNQRQDTLEAAQQAGFIVLKLLNEPNASALNFHYEAELTDDEHYSLVYDLGGGTFDVSIMKKDQDNLVVVATDGDTQLGGDDFDKLVADYVCTELDRLYGYDIREDKQGMNELLILCEEAKRNLSFVEETFIQLKDIIPSEKHVVTYTLTRQKLEELIMEMLRQTINITDRCVQSAKIDITRINDVILAGGSTRIPKIRYLLSEYFKGKKLSKLVNPDESVAKGAALQAAMLSEHPRQQIKKIQLLDIVPLSLGCHLWGGRMYTMIPKGSSIPTKCIKTLENHHAMQKSVKFQIYEGERAESKKNALLGEFSIKITPALPRQSEVYLTMIVDINGIFTITAKDKKIDVIEVLKIKNYTRGMRSDLEINVAIETAENYKDADARFSRLWWRRMDLYCYCEDVIFSIDTENLQDEYEKIIDRCQEMESLARKLEDEVKTEQCIIEIKEMCDPLIEKHKFKIRPLAGESTPLKKALSDPGIGAHTRGMRSDLEINVAIETAKKCKDADTTFSRLCLRREDLYNYCEQVIFSIGTKKLHQNKYKKIIDRCQKMKSLANNLEDEVKIEQYIIEIKQLCDPFIKKYKFKIEPLVSEYTPQKRVIKKTTDCIRTFLNSFFSVLLCRKC